MISNIQVMSALLIARMQMNLRASASAAAHHVSESRPMQAISVSFFSLGHLGEVEQTSDVAVSSTINGSE